MAAYYVLGGTFLCILVKMVIEPHLFPFLDVSPDMGISETRLTPPFTRSLQEANGDSSYRCIPVDFCGACCFCEVLKYLVSQSFRNISSHDRIPKFALFQ